MTPATHTLTATAAVYMHWNVTLSTPGETAPSSLPEIVNVLPGDTLVFIGATATVVFPDGLMDSEVELSPGTFRVDPLADDGSYTYRIVYPDEQTPPAKGTLRIGLTC